MTENVGFLAVCMVLNLASIVGGILLGFKMGRATTISPKEELEINQAKQAVKEPQVQEEEVYDEYAEFVNQ